MSGVGLRSERATRCVAEFCSIPIGVNPVKCPGQVLLIQFAIPVSFQVTDCQWFPSHPREANDLALSIKAVSRPARAHKKAIFPCDQDENGVSERVRGRYFFGALTAEQWSVNGHVLG